ncbi:MAG: nitrite reductase (NAD(P)H) small subunit [Candidatus Dormibacteraeota bacterium]|nr:nitrite reductase (NAD(P)H) small subunit [Candidatus Dormibacteraeota bacterium]
MAPREVAVCGAASLPRGAHIVITVGTRELGVFNIEGEVFALPNACPHQNGPLCKGIVTGTLSSDAHSHWQPRWVSEGNVIVCPWHSREFDIRTGRCLADPGQRVPVYRGRISDDQVMLTLPR